MWGPAGIPSRAIERLQRLIVSVLTGWGICIDQEARILVGNRRPVDACQAGCRKADSVLAA